MKTGKCEQCHIYWTKTGKPLHSKSVKKGKTYAVCFPCAQRCNQYFNSLGKKYNLYFKDEKTSKQL